MKFWDRWPIIENTWLLNFSSCGKASPKWNNIENSSFVDAFQCLSGNSKFLHWVLNNTLSLIQEPLVSQLHHVSHDIHISSLLCDSSCFDYPTTFTCCLWKQFFFKFVLQPNVKTLISELPWMQYKHRFRQYLIWTLLPANVNFEKSEKQLYFYCNKLPIEYWASKSNSI